MKKALNRGIRGRRQNKSLFRIEQKGKTFDQDFGYSFPLFYSLLKKERRRKGECIAKIKSHDFLLDPI